MITQQIDGVQTIFHSVEAFVQYKKEMARLGLNDGVAVAKSHDAIMVTKTLFGSVDSAQTKAASTPKVVQKAVPKIKVKHGIFEVPVHARYVKGGKVTVAKEIIKVDEDYAGRAKQIKEISYYWDANAGTYGHPRVSKFVEGKFNLTHVASHGVGMFIFNLKNLRRCKIDPGVLDYTRANLNIFAKKKK
jgi:hypothetical protein